MIQSSSSSSCDSTESKAHESCSSELSKVSTGAIFVNLPFSLQISVAFITFVLILFAFIVYKLLRTPKETDSNKLYLGVLPVERWRESKQARSKAQSKPIRVALLTYGTRGDVQPLVALAQNLKKFEFEAIVCTADSFQSFIESQGCRFSSCGIATVEQPSFLFDSSKASSFSKVLQVVADIYPKLATGMWAACREFQPDLIISQAVVRGIGAQIAEKLCIPHWVVHFAPSNSPTYEFPPAEYALSRYGWVNKLKYAHRNIEIAKAALATGLSKSDELFRRDVLGLPAPLDPLVLVRDMERDVSIHAYSPVLQPKPRDWPQWHLVVGAFTLEDVVKEKPKEEAARKLDSDLDRFLNEGGPNDRSVYIGFGSMEGAEAQFEMAVRCVVRDLRLRAVVCADISKERLREHILGGDPKDDSRVILIRSAPHDLLFPRCALVIHHGGAGTTNAAIQAGVPQVVIPILPWSDQPFWANVVQRLGIGLRGLGDDPKLLVNNVRRCLEDEIMQERALALKFAKHPDGAERVAAMVNSLFRS